MDKSDSNISFKKIVSQSEVFDSGKEWHRNFFEDIESRLIGNSDFPCIFSKNAFRKQIIKFLFVESIEINDMQHLAEGLKEYVEISKQWEGDLDTAYPLIVGFSLNAINAKSVSEYHSFGWKVLQKLHELDPAFWPEEVTTDPNSSAWSMCFNGMQLFCNMSNPAHKIRRSRNLGRHFIFVINPRERFDIFAGNTPSGNKVRSNIRDRINHYDGVPHAVQLASYGSGAPEWQQYGLIEDNVQRTDKCPFKFMKSK